MKRSKFSEEQVAYALRQALAIPRRGCGRGAGSGHRKRFPTVLDHRGSRDGVHELRPGRLGAPTWWELDFTRPGKPTHNSDIVSFNPKLRAECLNMHQFVSLADAQGRPRSRWWRGGGTKEFGLR